ncbi:glutamate synthase, partial [Amycolatopsis sp. NPDC049252]
MADPTGFLKYDRDEPKKKSYEERLSSWGEVYADVDPGERNEDVRKQASRCMDCGIPFCHSGGSG